MHEYLLVDFVQDFFFDNIALNFVLQMRAEEMYGTQDDKDRQI